MTRHRVIAMVILCGLFLLLFIPSIPAIFVGSSDLPAGFFDIILHSAGGRQDASLGYVVDLYNRGLGRKVVVASNQISWNVYPSDFVRVELIARGVPASDVISVHLPITDCGGERLDFLADYIRGEGGRRVLIVGDPEGSPLARRMISRRFGDRGVLAELTASPEAARELRDGWWRDHWKVQRMAAVMIESGIDLLYGDCR